jgi:16S rRNA A1518/A1519 N6-dimethyltransferase RsmA/KsgA/DIM1 with predicted DNA glycosylase/AP lyase activity
VELLDFISREAFRPEPRVDSHIVRIVPKHKNTGVDEAFLDGMLRHLFSQRRRVLRGVLKRAMLSLYDSPESLVGHEPLLQKRIFQLTTQELEDLSSRLYPHRRLFRFQMNTHAS